MISFAIRQQDKQARVGELITPHGIVKTPAFMPVATHGAVKTLTPTEVELLGSQLILSNTYHLYLSPGNELIKQIGGIHRLIGYDGPILTDSGGYQAFSLGRKNGGRLARNGGQLAKIDDEGVTFRSHRDGSTHRFTPKKVIDIQCDFGVDIMMPLDDCPPSTSAKAELWQACDRTHRWLDEQVEYWQSLPEPKPALFGIAQGGTDKQLRRLSIEYLTKLPLAGCALGGLAVGECTADLYETVAWAAPLMSETKPRYLMGVGNPADMMWAVQAGIDLFDCVLPTRLARHGSVWLVEGDLDAITAFENLDTIGLINSGGIQIVRYAVPHSEYKSLTKPLQLGQKSPLKGLTWASANHLAKSKEIGLYRQFTAQNLWVINTLLTQAQQAIALQQLETLSQNIGYR